MAFPSRKKTHDLNTPPEFPSHKSRGAQHRTTIRSHGESISNSSAHTISTAATRKDLFNNSEKGPGGVSSISDRKSSHTLQKRMFRFRNQSRSTAGTTRQAGSVRSSTATSLSQGARSYNITSFEGKGESPLPSTLYNQPTLAEPGPSSARIYGVPPITPLDDLSTNPSPYGESQPFATTEIPTEIPTADKPLARDPSSLPPPTDRRMGTASTSHNIYDTSSPSAPPGRRASKTTVEYAKTSRRSIKGYERILRKAEGYGTAIKDPFVSSTQVPQPSSRSDFYADPNVFGTSPMGSLSVSATPADSIAINSRTLSDSATTKGNKADFLKSQNRPDINLPAPIIIHPPPQSLSSMYAPTPHHTHARRMAQSKSDPTPIGVSHDRNSTLGRLFKFFSRTPNPNTARARAKESQKKEKSRKDKSRRKRRDDAGGADNDNLDDGASFSSENLYPVLPIPEWFVHPQSMGPGGPYAETSHH